MKPVRYNNNYKRLYRAIRNAYRLGAHDTQTFRMIRIAKELNWGKNRMPYGLIEEEEDPDLLKGYMGSGNVEVFHSEEY